MKKRNLLRITVLALFVSIGGFSQESNIQTYTPSKLLKKGQLDVKWFNNFYSEKESSFIDGEFARKNFYTSTFETFFGVSENSRLNIGLVFNVKSNNLGGKGWFSPLGFNNEKGVSRSGITSIAPSISFQPIESVGNFSIRSSFYIPLIGKETGDAVFDHDGDTHLDGVYLDKKSYVWETKFFFDHTFPSGDWQIFTELDTQLNFGKKEEGFANNSLGLPISAFLSYFPTNKSTIFVQAQQYFLVDLGNDFGQEYTQLGIGAKYQITSKINLETSYTNFVRGSDTGFGETINFGLRFLSN